MCVDVQCVWVYIATVAYCLHIVAHFVNVCVVLYCSLSTVIPSGRLLTDEQIFIIVGVVVGTVVLIVTLLSIIFVILAIRDRKNNGSRRKRK